MAYYFTKSVNRPFEEVVAKVREELKKRGFGVLTEIDVKAKMHEKLGVDFRDYLILGACNPPNAYKALQLEDKIGVLLPCNVVIQKWDDGRVEISAVDPVESMASVNNPRLSEVALPIRLLLQEMVEAV
jgi:uncharacterized protein (DUF302 family)